MPPKIIIFTGAPDALTLNWDDSNLLTLLQPSIARFCGKDTESILEVMTTSQPSWSLLSYQRHNLTCFSPKLDGESHISQDNLHEVKEIASPISTSKTESYTRKSSQNSVTPEISVSQPLEQGLSQFYEESYIRHKDEMLPLSIQKFKPNLAINSSLTDTDDSSFDSSFEPSLSLVDNMPISGCLTDIKDIPTATYLDSIYPQTVTCNIIVGIIKITEARAIKTRRGQTVELIELLVGDETKPGFTINFWLNSLSSRRRSADTNNLLYKLRTQDIVLIQNMALNSFQGKVYGQSLRRELTKIHLLNRYRNFGFKIGRYNGPMQNSSKSEIQNLQIAKTNRVLEWLVRSIRVEPIITGEHEGIHELLAEQLPPDTQETQ
ncbi:hypothetical protein OnM2_017044 [Erysiphe neolycopersici]|uniref:Uncharacterized protein n=1 Tax=Erysiphe neolycopersici TaxID=212602 RepID=A0A420I4P3_9PEZI|nr:hypothetical protein OnM2_017044 [Erysiphe neolycopersici]